MPAPVAEANDGLLALTVSTPAGADWLFTLHSCRANWETVQDWVTTFEFGA